MDLYIFGAGASAAEGLPATADFLARAYQDLAPDGFDPRVRQVWRFLETLFETPVDGPAAFARLPPIDELISLIDWSLHMDQGLGPVYDPPRLRRVRAALEHLICTALAVAQVRAEGADGPHARFAAALAARPPGSFALLSLNYDTMLDQALWARGLTPDYGLGGRTGGPLLLKLHGSLNWAHCTACDQIAVSPERVAHRLPGPSPGFRCPSCGSAALAGVIISPTLWKRYTLAPLLRVWSLALDAVRAARQITFVGYSLPPGDLPVHHLLRRGLLTRGDRPHPVVRVITHTPAGDVTLRFTRLFGPGVAVDAAGFRGQC